MATMKNLSILGSTGSIGKNALKIAEMFPGRFAVRAIAAKSNIQLLAEQIRQFHPEVAVVYDEKLAKELKALIPNIRTEIVSDPKAINLRQP
ncbi:MAG: 1-deoxy-D-xylulose-5-phosphate reductoisomerase, partial [Desulfobacteraceae bacterium]|nr:1-deoxy-D-xylulose-5-phosphate reductoisomerase [Desulfobacteraceae bacterium]